MLYTRRAEHGLGLAVGGGGVVTVVVAVLAVSDSSRSKLSNRNLHTTCYTVFGSIYFRCRSSYM